MINLKDIKAMNIKESSVLTKIKAEGENKMYNYLSGNDEDSSYTGENVKSIMAITKKITWEKVEDPSNALFSIGYSEQGNIIGILTNANALLQDMLLYCDLEEAKRNLKKVLTIPVGEKPITGRRYGVDGKSPLTFALPVITKGGYKSYAVVIHNRHADEFIKILESLDINVLTKEDMLLIAKDISFISRTQELAIDVAKDKTIQIVDTSEWLAIGVKPVNYWLSQNKKTGDWLAKENLQEVLNCKNKGTQLPEFEIKEEIPDFIKSKVSTEVITSESIAREVLKKATEDYFNNHYKEMLTYATETELNIKCKSIVNQYPEVTKAFKKVFIAYRAYMIDNIPQYPKDIDMETASAIRKASKEKTEAFANICRNTIYKIGMTANLDFKTIAELAYGTDLTEISKNEGKYFRAIMPEEFKKLYANGKTAIKQQRLYFVDEFTQDLIDDGEEIIVDFIKGEAKDKDGILIARTSVKYNAVNAKLVFDEVSGHFLAETTEGINLPAIGNEILIQITGLEEHEIENINTNTMELEYASKTPNNRNVLFIRDEANIPSVIANLGYMNHLTILERAMLLNSNIINNMIQNNKLDTAQSGLDSFEIVNKYNLYNKIKLNKVIIVNKDNEYRTDYAIMSI